MKAINIFAILLFCVSIFSCKKSNDTIAAKQVRLKT